MNRPVGSGPQPLRGLSGNAFQTQQQASGRTGTLGSGRLQNGKLTNTASTTGWGYASLGMAGAGGLPTPQSRANPLSSFASTIGGSQSQASLDLSEFPSLSGASRSQQGSSAQNQNLWNNNSNLRAPQAAPVQRPQSQTQLPLGGTQSTSHQRQPDQLQDSQGSSYSQFGSGISDYRNVNYGSAAALSGTSDHIDEFPPLGGLGGADVLQPRRAGPGQNSQANSALGDFGVISSGTNSQSQAGVLDRMDGNQEAASTTRSHLDGDFQDRDEMQSITNYNMSSSVLSNPYAPQSSFANNILDDQLPQSGDDLAHDDTGSSQMSDADRYGLPGLLDQLRDGHPFRALRLGMDLNKLDLDLHRSEPLHVDYTGPFAHPGAPLATPYFKLPPAYKVMNVPSLKSKIPSFSDETLFAIFYQNPRDKAQEWAAAELYSRDWRWNKKERCWMMKAKEYGEPLQLSSRNEERGWYYFFDVNAWKRERREYTLNYDDLYHIPQSNPPGMQPAMQTQAL